MTTRERLLAGEHSSRLRNLARETGGELVGRGKRMATHAIRDGAAVALEEAERVGLTPERVVRKVKRIAQRVGETMGRVTDDD